MAPPLRKPVRASRRSCSPRARPCPRGLCRSPCSEAPAGLASRAPRPRSSAQQTAACVPSAPRRPPSRASPLLAWAPPVRRGLTPARLEDTRPLVKSARDEAPLWPSVDGRGRPSDAEQGRVPDPRRRPPSPAGGEGRARGCPPPSSVPSQDGSQEHRVRTGIQTRASGAPGARTCRAERSAVCRAGSLHPWPGGRWGGPWGPWLREGAFTEWWWAGPWALTRAGGPRARAHSPSEAAESPAGAAAPRPPPILLPWGRQSPLRRATEPHNQL